MLFVRSVSRDRHRARAELAKQRFTVAQAFLAESAPEQVSNAIAHQAVRYVAALGEAEAEIHFASPFGNQGKKALVVR